MVLRFVVACAYAVVVASRKGDSLKERKKTMAYVVNAGDADKKIKKLEPFRSRGYRTSISAEYSQRDPNLYIVYSYSTEIAWFYTDIGFVITNQKWYSRTTSNQQYMIRLVVKSMGYVELQSHSATMTQEYRSFIRQLRSKYVKPFVLQDKKHFHDASEALWMDQYRLWENNKPAGMAVTV